MWIFCWSDFSIFLKLLMRGFREITQSGFITFSGWPNTFTSYTFPQNLDILSLHFKIVFKVECAKSEIFFGPKSLLISNLKNVDILLIRFFHFLDNFSCVVSVMLRDRVWLLSQVDQTHLLHILFLRIWIFRLLISESR